MSYQRYPNASYPTPWAEGNMVKAGDVPVNEDGGVSEIQSVWNDATGGTAAYSFDGEGPTSDVPFDADNESVKAQGLLTIAEQVTDGDSYTIDSKVYVLEDSLTDVDGNVYSGGSEAQAKLNIIKALDLSGLAGTDYALSMTAHPTVDGAAFDGDDAVLTAKTAGAAGNSIVITETGQGFTHEDNVFDAGTLGTETAGSYGIETELELLASVGNVSVTGDGTLASPWLIEFLNPTEEDIPLITADDSSLSGDTIGTTIAEYLKGRKSLEVVAATAAPL